MHATLHRFRSACLGNERDIRVRAPDRNAAPRALVVFLDAEFYRERVQAPAIVEALDHRPVLYAYVSSVNRETRRMECPCHPPFAAFVANEFMPSLKALHPGTGACATRVLVGLSYTGLAASFVALQTGELFTAVISQSGSYWSRDEWLTRQFAALPAPLPVRFHLEVGRREIQEEVQDEAGDFRIVSQVDGVRRFRDALVATGHTVNYHEFDGGHEFACWRDSLPAALRWALGS